MNGGTSNPVGRCAMVLAAGRGVRMRPLTNTVPKPLVAVAGQPMIGHAFAALEAAGIERAVVNVHYLPEQVEAWIERQHEIDAVVSDERDLLLDTGGGVARALPRLGHEPFFVLNSDSFWRDGETPALCRMRTLWNANDMDCLLLLSRLDAAVGYSGQGDFVRSPQGRLKRRIDAEPDLQAGALAYTGCCLIARHLFDHAPQAPFSMNILWNRAIAGDRLYGVVHDDLWLHVGTPDAVALAEQALAG